ncbi:hypothetical protein Lalb_Chr11g0069961 [Lupinus albus]|uniref:Uncharacterized protein n=1 Tax=Lupinus albus TaxID=3870 RepID=A0A6A4PRS2_LUPAL|nr:hypothetical protein Lalb_Chr11g0069961 [Lupinus albus]
MIMDELVSHQGYITTRVDALQAQNQQVWNDIMMISNRLDHMDIDDDKSEAF